MYKSISNKVNEIYKALNTPKNDIPQLVLITLNNNASDNNNKWQISETYYNKKQPTASKTNKFYVSDYHEYLDVLDQKTKAIVIDRPHTAIIIDDIGLCN